MAKSTTAQPSAMLKKAASLPPKMDRTQPANYLEFARLELKYTKFGPCRVTWIGYIKVVAGQITDRLCPWYQVIITPDAGAQSTMISLRDIGAQARFLGTRILLDEQGSRDGKVFRQIGTGGPKQVSPAAGQKYYVLAAANPGEDTTPPYDKSVYWLYFEKPDPYTLICCYDQYAPGGIPLGMMQLQDGGPPSIPPGSEH